MKRTHLNYMITISAVLAIASEHFAYTQAFAVLKPLTTVLIILVVVIYGQEQSSLKTLAVVALIACLGGDVLLLQESRFAYGLSSFLLAHLIFAYVFCSLTQHRFNYWPLLALTLISTPFYLLLWPHLGELAIPVAIYQACICVMCWLAINLFLERRDQASRLLAIASALFVFSDSMIALNKFLMPFELSGLVILSTYWLSIAIIANVFTSSSEELMTLK